MFQQQLSPVSFFFEKKVYLSHRTQLKAFIQQLFKKEKTPLLSITYVFVSDARLLAINQTYLKHNYYTDIITFDLSEGVRKQAEVYISVDRVKENARNLGIAASTELRRVIFHGALHICGYRDNLIKEKLAMRAKEDFYLQYYKEYLSQ